MPGRLHIVAIGGRPRTCGPAFRSTSTAGRPGEHSTRKAQDHCCGFNVANSNSLGTYETPLGAEHKRIRWSASHARAQALNKRRSSPAAPGCRFVQVLGPEGCLPKDFKGASIPRCIPAQPISPGAAYRGTS